MLSYIRKTVTIATANWGSEMAVRWIMNIVVAINVALGTAIIVGGTQRFPSPTYEPLVRLVAGEVWIWGFWILASALIMMIPTKWPQVLGLWLAMCWQILWCTAFSIAIVYYPSAGATEAVAHGGFALINAALLTARIVEPDGG